MANTILILGGARSGKSRFAQQLAQQLAGDDVLFVATAEALDDEMRERIAAHKSSRPPAWSLIEAQLDVGDAICKLDLTYHTVIVECLTLLISNVILAAGDPVDPTEAEQRVNRELDTLLDACRETAKVTIIVSGEVGMGLVPETPLGRLFRDLHGRANQTIAATSDAVYQLIAGIPLDIKALAADQTHGAGQYDQRTRRH